MTVKIDGSTGVDKVQPSSIDQEDLKWVPPFTKEYVSSEQIITAGVLLTLPHGFGEIPKIMCLSLVCKTAEAGYAVGDIVDWYHSAYVSAASANRGCEALRDAVNIQIVYGSTAGTFELLNKATGAIAGLTNANWRLIVRAWA